MAFGHENAKLQFRARCARAYSMGVNAVLASALQLQFVPTFMRQRSLHFAVSSLSFAEIADVGARLPIVAATTPAPSATDSGQSRR